MGNGRRNNHEGNPEGGKKVEKYHTIQRDRELGGTYRGKIKCRTAEGK